MAAHSCIGHVLQPAPVYYAYGYWPEEPMVWQPSEIWYVCVLRMVPTNSQAYNNNTCTALSAYWGHRVPHVQN